MMYSLSLLNLERDLYCYRQFIAANKLRPCVKSALGEEGIGFLDLQRMAFGGTPKARRKAVEKLAAEV